MKMYHDYLRDTYELKNITYIEYKHYKDFYDKLKKQSSEIHMYDPTDHTIYSEYKELGIKYRDSQLFITPLKDIRQYYIDHDKIFDTS